MALRDIEDNIRHLTLATVSRVETVFRSTESIPGYMAALLEHQDAGRRRCLMISNAVSANPVVYGCAIAFEPGGAETAACIMRLMSAAARRVLNVLAGRLPNYHYFDWDCTRFRGNWNSRSGAAVATTNPAGGS